MTVGIHITENWGDILDVSFRKIYQMEFDEYMKDDIGEYVYGMESSNRNFEKMSGAGSFTDLQEFDGTVHYDTSEQLYDKTTYFPPYALGAKVARMLVEDDLHGVINNIPRLMAQSTARTLIKKKVTMLNNAFTGTTGGDSLSLCNASHPYSPTDATTQSNKGTSAFSVTALEATRIIGQTAVFNNRGELLDVDYDTIIAHPLKQPEIWEVIKSDKQPGTANNNANFYQGLYKLVVSRRLSSSTNWFMLDSRISKLFFKFWTRIAPDFSMVPPDSDTFVRKWTVYERSNADFYAWHPIYGHLSGS